MSEKIFIMPVAKVYSLYVKKAERKGRSKAEVDEIIMWLTGFDKEQLAREIQNDTDFENFFLKAPQLNPAATSIKGVICGVRVEEIKDPLMQKIRYLDKLVDELAKGKAMAEILRSN
ncbi:DUF2200 domain-containing protein [Enterococcus sp. S86.2]|uniref:DUF2200 domain-containing protein n=1 Tax=Enterococcus sp. S86.2 TaxID=3031299 RepID=UPI0026F0194E|nr:DUF2200 domain-containing protein [Enterococcus sp. S86.2]